MEIRTPPPPPGYERLFRSSPFLDLLGPFYFRTEPPGFTIGMAVAQQHTNNSGTLHGGVVSAIADVSLAYTTAKTSEPPLLLRTVHLSIDFVDTAAPGDWVESKVTVTRKGQQMAFAHGRLAVGSRVVATYSGNFLVAGTVEVA